MRDISFYAGRSLREILELEKPRAVIFTSVDAFAHRAFNRYCRAGNVPTLHLFHGLQHLMEIPFKTKPVPRLWRLRHHVRKLLRYFLPVYARSLWETKASLAEWRKFVRDIGARMRGVRARTAASDSKTDRACVYIDSDIDIAMTRYGHSEREVFAVGNPDLVSFGLTAPMVGSCARQTSDYNDVMYIETALTEYGFVYESRADFVKHVLDTAAELALQNKRLVFKPHPAQAPPVVSAIANAGIDVCTKEDFLSRLQRCCAAITEPSTASLIPALLGLPLFLAKYGKLRGQSFGELLHSYPRARSLVDLRDFGTLLFTEGAELDVERTRKWIEKNIGPLPAHEMPSRVANIVLALIVERQCADQCA